MVTDQLMIAQRLKLSPATVCRSLKNDPAIHPDTRIRVAEMANKLGYRPRVPRAGSVRKRKLMHVGALINAGPPTRMQPHLVWNRVLWGMSYGGSAVNASVHVAYVPDASPLTKDRSSWPPMLAEEAVSGVLLMGTFPRPCIDLLKSRFACLQVIQHDPGAGLDCVDHDDRSSMDLLVRHLRERGHERIGFVTNSFVNSYSHARFAGYVAALAREGLAYDPELAINVCPQPLDMGEASARIAALARHGAKAWIGEHDGVGYDLIRRLTEHGLRVPEDVSVCGFDDLEPPPGLPKLTSIDAPFEAMGTAAVQRLAHRVANPTAESIHLLFSCRLIEGQSTGGRRHAENDAFAKETSNEQDCLPR